MDNMDMEPLLKSYIRYAMSFVPKERMAYATNNGEYDRIKIMVNSKGNIVEPSTYAITFELYNGEFRVESGILFDMRDAENVVMSGCVWYDYGTIYIITRNEDYEHYYGSNCLYYGHPDTSVGFEEFLKSQLPKVPVGILKLPERVA